MKNKFKSKLLSVKKLQNGCEIWRYKHYIFAGMKFLYENGKTNNNSISAIGYYYYDIKLNNQFETIQETKSKNFFY